MKPIEKDELYEHLGKFLQSKGIQLTEGSYTKGIHAGCSMLADAINLSQAGLERAKNELDKKLNQVRQVIHEKTAPKTPTRPTPPVAPPVIQSAKAGSDGTRPPLRKRKASKPKTRKAKGGS